MGCAQYLNSIQEMVDGTLGAIRRSELEQHLEACDACRALLDDLQRVRRAAAALPSAPPPDRVWLQIAGRLRQEGRIADAPPAPRRRGYAWLAVAAALLVATAGSLFVLYPRSQPAAPASVAAARPAGNAVDARTVETVQHEVEAAQKNYETAIAHLEDIAKANRQLLDPQTARTLDKNVAITDMAIADSSAAVKSEPTSVAAREALFDSLRQKAALLQDTIALINEMRKGNNAGAAEVLNRN
jgi:anti-sigma factor RsiW